MSNRIIMSPSKYIQASGAIEKLKDFASGLGSTFYSWLPSRE
jgi:hypothetical protein